MKDDQIVILGKNADAYANNQTSDSFDWKLIRDARFAQLVAAAEREACAKVCETFADRVFDTGFTPVEKEHPFSTIAGAKQCAADIRARAAIAAAKEI